MPTCQNCDNKWSWKQTFKKSFTLGTGMTCPFCGVKQYITPRSRKKSSLVAFIAPILLLSNLFFGPSLLILFVLIGSISLFLGLYPFYIEISNKEEPFW